MATWETAEAKKAASIHRSFGIKCRVIFCKHVSSYLAVYHDDTDDYYERLKLARVECDKQGVEHFTGGYVDEDIAKKRGITTHG